MWIWEFVNFLPKQKSTIMAMPNSPWDSWTLQEVKDPKQSSVNGASEEYVCQANRIKQIRILDYSIMGESSRFNFCNTAQGWTSSCINPFSSISKICIVLFENTSRKIPLTSLILNQIKMLLPSCPTAPSHITLQRQHAQLGLQRWADSVQTLRVRSSRKEEANLTLRE